MSIAMFDWNNFATAMCQAVGSITNLDVPRLVPSFGFQCFAPQAPRPLAQVVMLLWGVDDQPNWLGDRQLQLFHAEAARRGIAILGQTPAAIPVRWPDHARANLLDIGQSHEDLDGLLLECHSKAYQEWLHTQPLERPWQPAPPAEWQQPAWQEHDESEGGNGVPPEFTLSPPPPPGPTFRIFNAEPTITSMRLNHSEVLTLAAKWAGARIDVELEHEGAEGYISSTAIGESLYGARRVREAIELGVLDETVYCEMVRALRRRAGLRRRTST